MGVMVSYLQQWNGTDGTLLPVKCEELPIRTYIVSKAIKKILKRMYFIAKYNMDRSEDSN